MNKGKKNLLLQLSGSDGKAYRHRRAKRKTYQREPKLWKEQKFSKKLLLTKQKYTKPKLTYLPVEKTRGNDIDNGYYYWLQFYPGMGKKTKSQQTNRGRTQRRKYCSSNKGVQGTIQILRHSFGHWLANPTIFILIFEKVIDLSKV